VPLVSVWDRRQQSDVRGRRVWTKQSGRDQPKQLVRVARYVLCQCPPKREGGGAVTQKRQLTPTPPSPTLSFCDSNSYIVGGGCASVDPTDVRARQVKNERIPFILPAKLIHQTGTFVRYLPPSPSLPPSRVDKTVTGSCTVSLLFRWKPLWFSEVWWGKARAAYCSLRSCQHTSRVATSLKQSLISSLPAA
jgi:hypothetical protein